MNAKSPWNRKCDPVHDQIKNYKFVRKTTKWFITIGLACMKMIDH